MSAQPWRVPFISAGVVHRVFHPLRCVAEFTHGNKEISTAGTLQHKEKKKKKRMVHGFNIKPTKGSL